MTSYYAKIGAPMGGGERLVAVTGQLTSGLLRVVDVDIYGNAIGQPSYVPVNPNIQILTKDKSGQLTTANNDEEQKNDWAAHETTAEYVEGNEGSGGVTVEVSSVSPTNPAMAAFPELQGE
jgi:hypothetical protein